MEIFSKLDFMKIGKKIRFNEIRKVWKKENDFSDWLVTEEGVSLLAEELGIELENLTRESRPGDFPCDIVGNRLGDESHIVVIENQYGKTNHDHLGKLLTYAAVHKAMTGIWISETISDDHRQVIDWLNENTPSNVNLYLVALRLFKIDDSPVAPQLDIVCRPNESVKSTKSQNSEADIVRHKWRTEMWEQIGETILESKPPFRLQKPSYSHYSTISIGRSGFMLNMLLTPKNGSIGIELYCQVPWKSEAFSNLSEHKVAIEQEIGCSLTWQNHAENKSFRILLESQIDPKNSENLQKVKEWFRDYTLKMYTAFKDRIANLQEPV